jgi:hypothetical protein
MYFWTSGRIESGGSEENIVPAFHPNGRLVGEFILYLASFSINGDGAQACWWPLCRTSTLRLSVLRSVQKEVEGQCLERILLLQDNIPSAYKDWFS